MKKSDKDWWNISIIVKANKHYYSIKKQQREKANMDLALGRISFYWQKNESYDWFINLVKNQEKQHEKISTMRKFHFRQVMVLHLVYAKIYSYLRGQELGIERELL